MSILFKKIQRRHSNRLHTEKGDGNLLGEQIIELRDGLQSFQANAFESLYDRKISWDKNNTANAATSSIGEKVDKSTFFESLSTEELLQVIENGKDTDLATTESLKDDLIKERESSGVSFDTDEKKRESLAVRDIPVRPLPKIDEETVAENKKREIMKAQQSVIELFLLQQTETAELPPVAEQVIPVTKTESLQKVVDQELKEDELQSVPPPGGFFGFLNQDKDVVTIGKSASPAPTIASVAKPLIPSEVKQKGFFDFFNNGPPVAKKTVSPPSTSIVPKEQQLPAAKVAIPVPIVTKATTPPAVKASTPPFFNFLKQGASKVNSETIPEASRSQDIVTSAIASKITSKMASKNDGTKTGSKIDPVPKQVEDSENMSNSNAATPASGGGIFGFFNSKAVEKVVIPSKDLDVIKAIVPSIQKQSTSTGQKVPVSSKPTAEGMNKIFQRSVQRLLKEDSSKIKSFQKSTDAFRSGVLPAEAFLKTIETLFGVENVDCVLVPLIAELPERAAAMQLEAAYGKESAKSKPFKNPFSFSFGTQKKAPETESPIAAAMIQVPSVKKSFTGARLPVASSSKNIVFRVPSTVPIGKKVSIEKLMKALLAGEIDEKSFFINASTSLGKTNTLDIMPSIIAIFPNDIGSKITPLFKAYK